ncbi:MAG: hypothetical protein K2G38_00575 [Clostridia bacterium]|nr:hypothetical protein [Clostridia bacterium]
MKKFLAVIASVTLAISMLAFTGCKDKESNPNVINGNYKDATVEEVKTELSKVDFSNAFGDVTVNDYKLGLELSENLSIVMDTTVNGIGANYSIGTDTNYKLVCTDLENLTITGSGYANVSGKVTASAGKQKETLDLSLKTNVYNDSEYAYIDLYEVKGFDIMYEGLTTMKVKASFEDLIDFIGGIGDEDYPIEGDTNLTPADEIIVSPDESEEGGEIIAVPGMDINVLLQMLDQLKIKVALDTDNGLKAKISFTKESYEAILALAESDAEADEIGDIVESIAMLKDALTVNTLNIDIYIAFDANGLFSGFAVDCNIDVKINSDKVPDMPIELGDYTLKVTGGMNLKLYNGDITLPTGLATDKKYIDIFAE